MWLHFVLWEDTNLRQSGTEIPSILGGKAVEPCRMRLSVGLYFVHTGSVVLQVTSSTPPAFSSLLSDRSTPILAVGQWQCTGPTFFWCCCEKQCDSNSSEKLCRGPRCWLCGLSYLQLPPWGSQALLPPRTMYVGFKTVLRAGSGWEGMASFSDAKELSGELFVGGR